MIFLLKFIYLPSLHVYILKDKLAIKQVEMRRVKQLGKSSLCCYNNICGSDDIIMWYIRRSDSPPLSYPSFLIYIRKNVHWSFNILKKGCKCYIYLQSIPLPSPRGLYKSDLSWHVTDIDISKITLTTVVCYYYNSINV